MHGIRKREVNKKVLKVPEIEMKVSRHSLFFEEMVAFVNAECVSVRSWVDIDCWKG